MIDRLSQRYSCLPSQLLAEDVAILRMLNVLTVAGELDPANKEGNNTANHTGDIEASLANTSI